MDDLTNTLRSKLDGLRAKKRRIQQQSLISTQRKSKKARAKSVSNSKFRTLSSPNPFLDLLQEWKRKSEQQNLERRIFAEDVSDEEREKLFSSLPLDALDRFAWAIPDSRALHIIKEFSPIIEIGCGKGYWCRLLREMGVDIIAYDKHLPKPVDAWTRIVQGGSEHLSKHSNRALFLCYPDDFEESEDFSLAAECLEKYCGDTVILVGEWFGQTVLSNPGGKSIGIEAQLELASKFHLLLSVPLPSFPTSSDSLTVWRRTRRCNVDGEWEFADIPHEERIPVARACPTFSHLLDK